MSGSIVRAGTVLGLVLVWGLAAWGLAASASPLAGQQHEHEAEPPEPMAGMHARMHAMMQAEGEPAFVEVSAEASVEVPADRAHVRFAVETEAADAAGATNQNAERMDAMLRALRDLQIPGTEIETSGYSLHPVYSRPEPGDTRTIESYRALNHVEVTLDDVEAVGRVIDAGVGAGANRVAGISFEATRTRAARLDALRSAVEKAREEAETIAVAMGVPLGPPLEVRGGAEAPPPVNYRAAMFEAARVDVETPVEPGKQSVSASVTIRYGLRTGRTGQAGG